ncbi:MAG: glycosyltransferase [Barnesiella sp.]|nr:glycosyltransferase [Barnesiella sp.]
MKILQTIQGLSSRSGGPSSCLYHLSCGLNNLGIDTDILAIGSDNPQDDISHDPFIHYIKDDQFSPLRISRGYGEYLKNHIEDFDLVHANAIWTWHTHQAARYASKKKIPYIISPHGMLYPGGLQVSKLKKKIASVWYQRKDLQSAVLLHATCNQERDYIREFGLKNPIAVVPNCINISTLPTIRENENTKRRFGFIGRINRYKNIHLIIEAWHNLGDKTNDCELVIIGKGDDEYENELKSLIVRYGIKNVKFEGFLTGEALGNMINSLDFLILASISENFGMVVPEALLHGVPAITSKGTPWNDLPENGSGWWIDVYGDELKSTILTAITLPETTRREMGLKGREYILNNFMVDKVSAMMRDTYSWILNGAEKPDFVYV